VLFKKRGSGVPPAVRGGGDVTRPGEPGFYQIEFDMLLKGSVSRRKGRDIRQVCVMVEGAPRLVTSGDVVDRKIYDALIAAGAVLPGGSPAAGPDFPDTGATGTE
jgi:hypothetical protein